MTSMIAERPHRRLAGALTIMSAVLVTSLQDAMIKDVSGGYPIHQMQTIRCSVALLLMLGWTAFNGGLKPLFTTRPSLLLLTRSFVLSLASLSFYLALAAMHFPDAVSIYFSMPFMIAALSGLIIGEKVPASRWLAVCVAFVGVLIVMQPGTGVFEPASLIALFAALCYAIGLMLTRPLGTKIDANIIGFWQMVFYAGSGVLLSLVLGGGAFYDPAHPSLSYLTAAWKLPDTWDLLWLMGTGLGCAAATVLYTMAYRIAAPSFIAPLEYTALFWVAVWSYLFWRDVPADTTLMGAALIIAAGLWMLWKDRHPG
jgi:drug/metabolite transporter (DMT)-like permease